MAFIVKTVCDFKKKRETNGLLGFYALCKNLNSITGHCFVIENVK